ncbi:MAG: hypothetical protein FWE99_02005 [Bacteroidales bacterium]|nr:hypothetical protein [Bacteroidales bacterium]
MYLAIFAGLTAVGCKDYDYMPGVIKVNMTDKTIVLTNVDDFNEFEVSCPMSWAVTGTVPSWLGVDPPKGGAGITPTTITIKEAHTGDTPRTAILRFMAANGDKVAVTVTQNPSDPTPPTPVGEVIVYDGSKPDMLQPDPFGWGRDAWLYPSMTSLAYNQVSLTGGTVDIVFGGVTNVKGAMVAHNTVTMSGGEAYRVFGGWSEAGAATGNHVIISGGTVGAEVLGGCGSESTTGNTVSLSGTPDLSRAYVAGGHTFGGDFATGNTLEVTAQHPGMEIWSIEFFDKAIFYLPHNAADGDVMLKLSEDWYHLSRVTIDIDFAGAIPSLKIGDMITLTNRDGYGIPLEDPKNNNQIVSKNGYSFLIFKEDDKIFAQVTATP